MGARMGFVLTAYDPDREVSVPIARVIMLEDDYDFFYRLSRDVRVDGYGLMVFCVIEHVRRNYSNLLAPFDPNQWEFHLKSEGVAAVQGVDLNKLPTIDMT